MGQVLQDRTVGKMSDHDDEPREDFGASRDEETILDVDPETGEITEQTLSEAAEADGSEEQIKKAERAVATFNKRIDTIFGDNAPPLQCPRCEGLGRVWQTEEPKQELVHPDHLVTCDVCRGPGKVETGSTNPDYLTEVCTACGGRGYQIRTQQPENVTPIQPRELTYTGSSQTPVMGWQQPDGTFVPLGTPQAGNG